MLEVRGLTVRYGEVVAVAGVDLTVAPGEVVAVLGPSGCGKSSLLRGIAGLEPVDGEVRVDGQDVTALRPDQRHVSLMFQDQALFSHRDVAGNVAFGPRMRGWPRAEIDARVQEVLTLVGLEGFARRHVDELSGGQRQRVALARALAPRPGVLMLDEPLGSLDRALRDDLLAELPQVFADADAAVVYVTHDQDEALALADRVAVMRAGRIVQEGPPVQVWREPADAFVARFLGLRNLLPATVVDGRAETALGAVPADSAPPGPAVVALLPEAVRLEAPDTAAHPATVVRQAFAGDHVAVTVETAHGVALQVPVPTGRPPQVGAAVGLVFDPAATVVLPEGQPDSRVRASSS